MKMQTGESNLRKPLRQTILTTFFVSILSVLLLMHSVKAAPDDASIQSMQVDQPAARASHFSDGIKIRLAGGDFDPLAKTTSDETAENLIIQSYPQGQDGYFIVQFDGPIETGQKKILERMGARVFDYIPDFAFIVKMDDSVRKNILSMKNVRWAGIYQPKYRMGPALANVSIMTAESAEEEFIVSVFGGEDARRIVLEIEELGGTVLDILEDDDRPKIKMRSSTDYLWEVANIDGIKWIESAPVWKFHNDAAAEIMGVPIVRSNLNLFGAGQVVAVADTGLDRGDTDPDDLHDDFEDGSGNSRVSRIFDRVGDGADDENSGHGTHVAGSVLGNGAVSGSDPGNSDYDNAYAGIAPEATLVFQALEDNNTQALKGIPTDLGELFSQARDAGARIHTNSWGAAMAGAYTSASEDVDRFVWNNKDFLILFSAGNEGVDADDDGIIDFYSMGSPSTAKNCITVGATENGRPNGSSPEPGYTRSWGQLWPVDFPADPIDGDQVSDNPDGMAAFSSRGPCLDGRFKPDVVAPGTNVVSTKSSLTADTALWGKGGLNSSGADAQYIFSGGTSMSTPLAAGTAALVREFYSDLEQITPSAALIKATLLNGAVDISPGQYGSEAFQEIPDPPRPNNVSGWGILDLENSIFPAPPKVLRYHDETIGLSTGQTALYEFTVSDASVPLKVNLVWSDYPGSPVSGGGLVNDLDLTFIDPNSMLHYPRNGVQSQVISYDDGVHENGWKFVNPDWGFAVRFTPESYPAVLDEALFRLITSTTDEFRCNVRDDDGSNGMPGSNLFITDINPPYFNGGFGWVSVDIPGIIITEGSFYIELRFTSTSSNNPFLGLDESNTDDRSIVYNGSDWYGLPYENIKKGDWAIRAKVTGKGSDRINNVVGIDIANPDVGAYTLHVEGYNVPQGPQPYALVVSGGQLSNLTVRTTPNKPGSLSATPRSSTRIDLTWSDNSDNDSGFKIERRVSSGSWSEIARVGADVTAYSDRGCNEATVYSYRVRAHNAAGDSEYSNTAGATTFPLAPGNLTAEVMSSSRIDLSWTDNSAGETEFEIERKKVSGRYSRIAVVDEDVTSYSDTGLKASTTYHYRIRAKGSAGASGFSNVVKVKTLSVVEAFITRFYQLCLGRSPDQAGLDGWVTDLLNGSQTGSDVAYGFVFSQEFLSRNTSDEEFLRILYEAFFNRKADEAGKNAWLEAIRNGTSREDVLKGFIYAQEFNELCREYEIIPNPVAAFVTRFYQLCLKRDPDIAGLEGWVASLLSGDNVGADVAEGFVFSPEFTRSVLSDEEFMTILYKVFFNRDPDAAGLQGWLDALSRGTSRAHVLDGFIYSLEFDELCQKYGIIPFR